MTTSDQQAQVDIVLECTQLEKTYAQGPQKVQVLRDLNLRVYAGEQIAIVGSSGSGKTTLLNLLGGLDLPTSGSCLLYTSPSPRD